MNNTPYYAELSITTNFSFLRGASHAAELVTRAKELGLNAIGIADHNTLAGVVRAHTAAKEAGIPLLVGARLIPRDGPSMLCYPKNREAYGRLSRLLSLGKMTEGVPKGDCQFTMEDIKAHSHDQIFIFLPPEDFEKSCEHYFTKALKEFALYCPGSVFIGAYYSYYGKNREYIGRINTLSDSAHIPMIALNEVLYHIPDRRPLQDVITCIREHCTIHNAGYRLASNEERCLKSPQEIARLFSGYENAVARTREIVEACNFSLDDLSYQYPDEPVPPGSTPQAYLEKLTWAGAQEKYPDGIPSHVKRLLEKELALINDLDYAPYFLTVHDIVAWARKKSILCQGRGSAANSAVCYCLGITSVNPDDTSLLFERFLSKERKEPPDIDVDFEHERREEVIQYVYERYGRHRAALTATVISYRPRSAIREVCKALGLTEDIAAALAGTVWGSWGDDIPDDQIKQAGLDPQNPTIRQALLLTRDLIGFPRHLSQHVGGFVLTQGPLVETVPIGNAAMKDRTFIEWDKDDIDALGIMKVDVLALGMLTCIRKAFDLLKDRKGITHNLASIPPDDKLTYDMLCEGDSLGVFQVESRAQMNMLPRLRPRKFYDLVIEVAIVRPGPIQGDMVHPYLRRRNGDEKVAYPSPAREHGPPDELEKILKRTKGVPLFQEQAMQISIDAAKFTPEEANGLRRAMATFRKVGTIKNYEDMMVSRMIKRGYDPAFAKRCFDQIKGFGDYGFPESHAASFALLVYVSSWLKCHHPDVFCAALLNSQPMGFYAPAQIVRDARDHGVEVRPVDINYSAWDNALEPSSDGRYHAVRLGFRQVDGANEDQMNKLVAARGNGFGAVTDLRLRTSLPRSTIERLANADALRSLNLSRRQALWAIRGETRKAPTPLFANAQIAEQGKDIQTQLPLMPASEEVIQDYQATHLSLKKHPLFFLRQYFRSRGAITTIEAVKKNSGSWVKTAGVVLVRQRPGSAKGVVFITIEDETGIANLVVWPKAFAQYRAAIMGSRLLWVEGRVQTADNVTHIVAHKIIDRTEDLDLLSEDRQRDLHQPLPQQTDPLRGVLAHADEVKKPVPESRTPERQEARQAERQLEKFSQAKGPTPRHPRNIRIIPKSRDFH